MSVVLVILATMAAQQPIHTARAGVEAPGSKTLICGTVRETYTRIPRRVCLTAEELQARVEAAERSIPRPPRLTF
jgi:hypothetical protein